MPAAPLGERRGSSGSRTASAADRARPRSRRPSGSVPSKLRAARSVGVRAPAAAAVAALLAVLILVAALATGGREDRLIVAAGQVARGGGRLVAGAEALFDGGFAGLGFKVAAVRLQGASTAAQDEILRAAAIPRGAPIFGIDLAAVRARVERVGWVGNARVMRLLPDTLVIAVDQRPLAAIWQVGLRRYVVASGGARVSGVDPASFRTLPLIVGPGANIGFQGLLAEVARHPRVASRLLAVRRVDERRWDILLRDQGVILLPASGEAAALDRLDRLDRTSRALDLGLARIDLRNQHFTVVRPTAVAVAAGAMPSHLGNQ